MTGPAIDDLTTGTHPNGDAFARLRAPLERCPLVEYHIRVRGGTRTQTRRMRVRSLTISRRGQVSVFGPRVNLTDGAEVRRQNVTLDGWDLSRARLVTEAGS